MRGQTAGDQTMAASSKAAGPVPSGSELTAQWNAACGACRPVRHELRTCLHERWVRFHNLPGKRWPDAPADYAELLRRQRALLDDLTGGSCDLLVITASWTSTAEPGGRDAAVTRAVPDVTWWTTIQTDDGQPDGLEFAIWTHLWTSRASWPAEDLVPLLWAVANDETDGVIICPLSMNWLFAPYDGGSDVIAATAAQQDDLRRRHSDWLLENPAGL
jgi:hypothetical protein